MKRVTVVLEQFRNLPEGTVFSFATYIERMVMNGGHLPQYVKVGDDRYMHKSETLNKSGYPIGQTSILVATDVLTD